VAKKDRKQRIVQDYRYINQCTIKNRYFLSLITDILDRIEKRKVFTKLDLDRNIITSGSKKEMNGR